MSVFAKFLTGFLILLSPLVCGQAQAQSLVIRDVTIIDPIDGPSEVAMDVVVSDGKIISISPSGEADIPSALPSHQGTGQFLIPGLIDAHTHMSFGHPGPMQPAEPEDFLRFLSLYGVTGALNTGWDIEPLLAFRERTATSDVPLPEFYAVGHTIGEPGGWGGKMTGGLEPADISEGRAAVAMQAAKGVDAIKIVFDDMSVFGMNPPTPALSREMLSAMIDEAHAHGLKALVHAPELEMARIALIEGADALIHGIIDEDVDDAFVALMRKSGAIYVPTHVLYERGANFPAMAHRYDALDVRDLVDDDHLRTMWQGREQRAVTGVKLPRLRRNLRTLHEAGISIAMGTDTGVAGIIAGIASHMEIVLYVESAMSPLEALAAATIAPARLLGAEERLGRITPGYSANLVLLGSNPLTDIRAIADVREVWIAGENIDLP